jgi:Tol biopolymer transport system component
MRFAFSHGNPTRMEGDKAPSAIWVIDLDVGEPVQVTSSEHLNAMPVWLPDSRHLLFVSDRDGSDGVYVIEVGPSGAIGEPRRVRAISEPHSFSISTDGKKLVYSRLSPDVNIWSAPLPEAGDSLSRSDFRQETFDTQYIESFDVSRNGESLVFDTDRTGNYDIFKNDIGGEAEPVRLTSDPAADFAPALSPDGQEVAFHSLRSGNREIWVMPSTPSGEPEKITNHNNLGALNPRWSPDGLSIVYAMGWNGPARDIKIWIVSRDSVGSAWREPELLIDSPCVLPDFSPSGETIVCSGAGNLATSGTYVTDLGGNVLWEIEGSGLASFYHNGNLLELGAGMEVWVFSPDDPEIRSLLFRWEWGYGRGSIRWSSDRLFVAAGTANGDLYVVDLEWE